MTVTVVLCGTLFIGKNMNLFQTELVGYIKENNHWKIYSEPYMDLKCLQNVM